MKQKTVNFSIIQTGAVIEGDVSVKGKIVINGTIKGKLSADTVVISTEGTLLSKVEVEKMVIAEQIRRRSHRTGGAGCSPIRRLFGNRCV